MTSLTSDIGTNRTSSNVSSSVANRGKPDFVRTANWSKMTHIKFHLADNLLIGRSNV